MEFLKTLTTSQIIEIAEMIVMLLLAVGWELSLVKLKKLDACNKKLKELTEQMLKVFPATLQYRKETKDALKVLNKRRKNTIEVTTQELDEALKSTIEVYATNKDQQIELLNLIS